LAIGGGVFGLLVGGILVALLTGRSAPTATGEPDSASEIRSPDVTAPSAAASSPNAPLTWPRVVGAAPASTGIRSSVRLASSYPNWQAAVDALESGQSLVFDVADKGKGPLVVRRPLVDVQFVGGGAKWEWNANLTDCQFFYHDFESLVQTSGRLAHSAFYRCGFHRTRLTHTDTVSFYFDESKPLRPEETLETRQPIVHLDGFVRSAVFVRPFVVAATALGYDKILQPAIRIRPTDPVGNGRGSYILAPVVRNQRAWTPFEFAGGEGMTLAQSFSEGAEWADPLLESTGRGHAIVSTSFAAKPKLSLDDYNAMPPLAATRYGSEFSHAIGKQSPPYRGAAVHLTGFANGIVAHGDGVNTWSLGRQAGLPRLHYVDGIVAVDPSIRQYLSAENGSLSIDLAAPIGAFRMHASKSGTQFQSGDSTGAAVQYPADGPNLVEPILVPLGDLRVGPLGWLGSGAVESFAGKTIAEIEAALIAKKAIRLPTGIYTLTKPIRSGRVVGDGMGRTVLKFPKGIDCFEGGADGASNLTISGGKTGWNAEKGRPTPSAEFVRVRFEGQGDAAINLGGQTNVAVQDCEFVDVETAIANGRLKTTKAGTIHGLNVLNCTFGKSLRSAIDLHCDAATQGRVGIHNCRFVDSGSHAIHIDGGQTHLIQSCEIRSASAQAYVPSIDVVSGGTTVLSHIAIDNKSVRSSQIAISVTGSGVFSHLSIEGSKTALKVTKAFAADRVVADGTLEGAGESLLCRSKFSAPKLPAGVGILSADGKSVRDATSRAYEIPNTATAPPEVVFSSKVTSGGRKLTWNAVEDPIWGIVGYAIFSGGKEIGRAALEYEPPGAEHSPFVKPTKVLEYLDPDLSRRGYRVRAIDGAGMMSGGEWAQPFALGSPRGIFMKPGGKEEATGYGFFPTGKTGVQLVLPGNAKSQPVTTIGLSGQPNRVRFDRGWLTEDAKEMKSANGEEAGE